MRVSSRLPQPNVQRKGTKSLLTSFSSLSSNLLYTVPSHCQCPCHVTPAQGQPFFEPTAGQISRALGISPEWPVMLK